MDEDKLTDIIAILMNQERTDLIEYIKNLIECCDFDFEFSDEDSDSDSDSDDETEEIDITIDDNGFYSLN